LQFIKKKKTENRLNETDIAKLVKLDHYSVNIQSGLQKKRVEEQSTIRTGFMYTAKSDCAKQRTSVETALNNR